VGRHKPHCAPTNRVQGAGEWPNRAVQRSLGRIDFSIRLKEAVSDVPSMLVLSKVYHHGWSASVNGRPARVYPAYYSLLTTPIPEGKSMVVFTFSDATFC